MHDDGFTYPELLISLVITGLVSFLLIGIFFSDSGFVVKGRGKQSGFTADPADLLLLEGRNRQSQA